MTVHTRGNFADALCSHMGVEAFRVRIGGQFQNVGSTFFSAVFRVFEERTADSRSHVFWLHPHVLDFGERAGQDQRAAPDNLLIHQRHKDFVL